MASLNTATCPECRKQAHGKNQVIALFGLRNNGGHIMIQSWCRSCRLRERREKRQNST